MKKIYLLKKEADGSVSTLGEYDSTQAASNAAMKMCGTDGNIFDYDIKEVDVDEPRISSYEEACAALGKEPLDEPLMRSQGFRKYEIARRKLETIVASLNFETRQRALEKETNADNNTQTADTEPVSDVAQPAKVAMAETTAVQEIEPTSEASESVEENTESTDISESVAGDTDTGEDTAGEDTNGEDKSETGNEANNNTEESTTDDTPENDPSTLEYYIPAFFETDNEKWECRGAIPATGDMPSYGKDLRFTDSDTAAHAGKTFTKLYKQVITLEF